jgi:hypothetical protein
LTSLINFKARETLDDECLFGWVALVTFSNGFVQALESYFLQNIK